MQASEFWDYILEWIAWFCHFVYKPWRYKVREGEKKLFSFAAGYSVSGSSTQGALFEFRLPNSPICLLFLASQLLLACRLLSFYRILPARSQNKSDTHALYFIVFFFSSPLPRINRYISSLRAGEKENPVCGCRCTHDGYILTYFFSNCKQYRD